MPASGQPFGRRDVAVRRCLLAVMVVHDIDLSWDDSHPELDEDGCPDVQLDGRDPIAVPAARLAAVLADRDLELPQTITVLARWFRLRRTLHDVPLTRVLDGLRAVGLPAEHVNHPGPDWTWTPVPGGALTLGFGLLIDGDAAPDGSDPGDLLGGAGPIAASAAPAPVPLPAGLLEEVGIDPARVWPRALARLEELGGLAAARRRRRPRDPLRPLAEADVISLLGSRRFRFALASETPSGLAGLVVPMLSRGWVSNSSIDSAFGPAAAAATSEEQRGFPRPLLVTEYEVVQVPEGGHPLRYLGGQQQRSVWS